MKSTLFLVAIACILSSTLAIESEEIERVNEEVSDYIREQMLNAPMWRSAVDHFACYDDLTRKITKITNDANDKSEKCIQDATNAKASTMEKLKEARVSMSADVSKVHNSFFECGRKPVGLEYFQCLETAVTEDESRLQDIKAKSEEMIAKYASGLQEIATQEKSCLANVIAEARAQSNEGFDTLRECLGQGASA